MTSLNMMHTQWKTSLAITEDSSALIGPMSRMTPTSVYNHPHIMRVGSLASSHSTDFFQQIFHHLFQCWDDVFVEDLLAQLIQVHIVQQFTSL